MIYNLQFLRAVAASMIVMIHLQPLLYPIGYADVFDGMYAGVDIFFVISGFIMVTIVERRHIGAREFAIERLIRIAPVYWLFTLVLFLAAFVIPVRATAPPTLAGLLASLAFVPGAEPPQFMPILFVGWTLNLEIYFYALFAAALACGVRRDARLLLVGGVIAAMCLAVTLVPPASRLRFYGMPIACEFVAGMMIARFHEVLRLLPRLACLMLLASGVAALAIVSAVGADHTSFAYGVPAVLLVSAALGLEARGARITHQAVAVTATASYALYVTHPLVISAFINVQRRVALLQTPGGSVLMWLAAFAACLVFSLLVHRWLEAPMIDRLKARLGGRRSARLASSA